MMQPELHTMTVMSMNINGQDSWYPGEPKKQWKTRAPLVRNIIEAYAPKVVCWQEFGVTSHEDALSTSSHPQEFYMGEQAGDIYINPISWDPRYFRALARRTFWLSENGEYGKAWGGAERGCSAVLLESLGKAAKRYWVYNLHLDNQSKLARDKGTELVISNINQYSEGLPVIVAGDFNTSSWSVPGKEEFFDPRPLRLFEQAGFVDALKVTGEIPQIPLPTFHGYHGHLAAENHDPFGVWDPDHILIRGLQVINTEIIGAGQQSDELPSDHHPVYVELML